jgi:sensor histidine kinase YesM
MYSVSDNRLAESDIEWLDVKDKQAPNLGMFKEPIWVKLIIKNETSDSNLMLHYPVAYVNRISFYSKNSPQSGLPDATSGINEAHSKKIKDLGYHFEFEIPQGESKEVFFEIQGDQQLLLTFEAGTPDQFRSNRWIYNNLSYGIFVGVMLVMLFYNLFIFFFTRLNLYLHYVIYVTFSLLAQSALIGLYQNYFPIFGHDFNRMSLPFFIAGVAIAGLNFVYHFIGVSKHLPKWRLAFWIGFASYAVAVIILLIGFNQLSILILQVNAMYSATIILTCSGIIGFSQGNKPSQYLFYAWLVFMLGNFVYVLKDFGVLPYNWLTNNIIAIGTLIETVVISLALADLINRMRRDHTKAQLLLQRKESKNAQLQLALSQSELAALQGQMNPNFVFNALSLIQNDILRKDVDSANENIGSFAQLMRSGLDHSRSQQVSLRSEINFLTTYLEIEKKRYPNRFTYSIEYTDDIYDANVLIPPLMILPLCENAVKYAFSDGVHGKLVIRFEKQTDSTLLCTIDDNGIGIPQKIIDNPIKAPDGNYGLMIVRERIRLFSEQGFDCSCAIINKSTSVEGQTGTNIQLTIPYE